LICIDAKIWNSAYKPLHYLTFSFAPPKEKVTKEKAAFFKGSAGKK